MQFLSSLFQPYLRWRHSEGFGVHSPYAYRFVKDVIKPGNYGYYGYSAIEKEARKRNWNNEDLKLLLRTAIFLDTKRIIVQKEMAGKAGLVSSAIGTTLTVIKKSENLISNMTDLLIADSLAGHDKSVEKAISSGTPVIAFDPDPSLRQLMVKPLERGVLFDGLRIMILIPRQEMAYVRYTTRFS